MATLTMTRPLAHFVNQLTRIDLFPVDSVVDIDPTSFDVGVQLYDQRADTPDGVLCRASITHNHCDARTVSRMQFWGESFQREGRIDFGTIYSGASPTVVESARVNGPHALILSIALYCFAKGITDEADIAKILPTVGSLTRRASSDQFPNIVGNMVKYMQPEGLDWNDYAGHASGLLDRISNEVFQADKLAEELAQQAALKAAIDAEVALDAIVALDAERRQRLDQIGSR
ncbi:MAG: hypothetical protein H7A33_06990 [Deltaproteobacteria bacterium]|nr:hypothetical protein [Deltaproteobacteria bacterium]